MTKRITLVAFLLILAAGTSAAQTTHARNFWIMPTAGFRSAAYFGVESEETGITSIRFSNGFIYGLSIGYQASSIISFELAWNRHSTSVTGTIPGEDDAPAVNEPLFEAFEDQVKANFLLSTGYDIGPVKPFFLLGLGITRIDPRVDIPGITRFCWAMGIGFEAPFSDRFGLRAQGKFVPTYINTSDEVLFEWNGGNQTIQLRNTMTQWEYQAGLFFRF